MEHYDYRTKPSSQWTFYVVDDLSSAGNIFYVDTIEQAIQMYNEFSADKHSAIGGSLEERYSLDFIQRFCDKSVFISDCERMSNVRWQDPEIQEAINKAISELHVTHELSGRVFGSRFPSVGIPLRRGNEIKLNSYFSDKILCSQPINTPRILSSIREVHMEGVGWVGLKDFLDRLNRYKPRVNGVGTRLFAVDKINAFYINENGYTGQVDVSPEQFCLLKEKTEPILEEAMTYTVLDNMDKLSHLIHNAGQKMKPSLDQVISEANKRSAENIPSKEVQKGDIQRE